MSKKKQKDEKETDIIIVGAGLAGCVLAFHLANARLKVKVFEKRKRSNLGHSWCDSIENDSFKFAGIPPPKGKEKKPNRDKLAVLTPDLESIAHEIKYNYWIVDRQLLHKRLLKLAEKAGALFFFETEIVEPIGHGQWVVGVKKKNEEIENARLIVDCSGRERILSSNIEVLDLNIELKDKDFVEAYRETHKVTNSDINWEKHPIKNDTLYYRYGYEKGYSWLNFEDDNILDVGAGVGVGYTDRSAKAIVNSFVNSNKNVEKQKQRGGGGRILMRRPFTLVWYGFMSVGESAGQVIPTTGCGVGSAMKAAKIAAEVIVPAVRRREVSIDRLWEYQVRYTKERGKDLAALDMMRRQALELEEEELGFLLKKKILTKKDFEFLIHGKYSKITFFKQFLSIFKGLSRPKLLWKMRKIIQKANRVYKHYKKIPKEYHPRKYHDWLLEQLYYFREIEENE